MVIKRLMDHACAATGIALQEASNAEHPKPGEYVRAASRDASAPSGVVKVLVKSKEDVRKSTLRCTARPSRWGKTMLSLRHI